MEEREKTAIAINQTKSFENSSFSTFRIQVLRVPLLRLIVGHGCRPFKQATCSTAGKKLKNFFRKYTETGKVIYFLLLNLFEFLVFTAGFIIWHSIRLLKRFEINLKCVIEPDEVSSSKWLCCFCGADRLA